MKYKWSNILVNSSDARISKSTKGTRNSRVGSQAQKVSQTRSVDRMALISYQQSSPRMFNLNVCAHIIMSQIIVLYLLFSKRTYFKIHILQVPLQH